MTGVCLEAYVCARARVQRVCVCVCARARVRALCTLCVFMCLCVCDTGGGVKQEEAGARVCAQRAADAAAGAGPLRLPAQAQRRLG